MKLQQVGDYAERSGLAKKYNCTTDDKDSFSWYINLACDQIAERAGVRYGLDCEAIIPLCSKVRTAYVWYSNKPGVFQLPIAEIMRLTAVVRAEIPEALFGWYVNETERPELQHKYKFKDRKTKSCE